MNAPFECIYYNEIRSHNSTADILKTKNRWQIHYQGKKNTYTKYAPKKQEKEVQKIKNRSSSTLIKEVKE